MARSPVRLGGTMAGGRRLGNARRTSARCRLDLSGMLYYNNPMAHHHGHSAPTVSRSILRLSVWQRLAAALALSAVIWAVTWWAMA
jgi:hypothetical protein